MCKEKKKIYNPKDDPQFQKPFIDVDEWRDRKGINYRMMHGGFEGTNVKFLFCFPEKENFKGRFFQHLSPFPGPNEEYASMDKFGEDDKIAFAISHGAYFVECNMGSGQAFGSNPDPSMIYRSNAAAAEYSRKVAMEIYDCSRPFGYAYGGSGGGYKTMSCIENTNAFDGAVPYVIGSPVALPNVISIRAHGMRILRNVIPQIKDALEPGGSGDPYAGLNEDEKAALKEITRFGFPLRAWLQWPYLDDGSLPVLAPGVKMSDPDYFKVFWTEPGYLGADPNGTARRDRIYMETTIKEVYVPTEEEKAEAARFTEENYDGRNGVDDAWKKMIQASAGKPWITVEEAPGGDDLYLSGCNVIIKSGEAEGKTMLLGNLEGNKIFFGNGFGMDSVESILKKVKPGDKVMLDNSDYIAIQSFHRHQVPEIEYTTWDQYRDENKQPLYPQRHSVLGRSITFGGAGSIQDGQIQGKVIVVASLEDESAFPWQADWYRRKVASVNPEKEEEIFRLWFMEHCNHGDVSAMPNAPHLVPYLGALHQALLSVSDWVERGIVPNASSVYTVDDGQVIPAATANERKGVQPVVTLKVNGSDCVHVKVGEKVFFEAYAEVPEKGGKITYIDFSFEGETEYSERGRLEFIEDRSKVISKTSHIYNTPGTYFAVARAKSNLNGDSEDIFTQIQNLSRVRVIVE